MEFIGSKGNKTVDNGYNRKPSQTLNTLAREGIIPVNENKILGSRFGQVYLKFQIIL